MLKVKKFEESLEHDILTRLSMLSTAEICYVLLVDTGGYRDGPYLGELMATVAKTLALSPW